MELKMQLGVSYPTRWKIKHKLMQAVRRRDGEYLLWGLSILMMPISAGNSMGARLVGDQRTRFP